MKQILLNVILFLMGACAVSCASTTVKKVTVPEIVKVGVPGNSAAPATDPQRPQQQQPASAANVAQKSSTPPSSPTYPSPFNPNQEYFMAMKRQHDVALQSQRDRLKRLEMDLSLKQSQSDFERQMEELSRQERALAAQANDLGSKFSRFKVSWNLGNGFLGTLWRCWVSALRKVDLWDVILFLLVFAAIYALAVQLSSLLYPAFVVEGADVAENSAKAMDDDIPTADNASYAAFHNEAQRQPTPSAHALPKVCATSDLKEIKDLCNELRTLDKKRSVSSNFK